MTCIHNNEVKNIAECNLLHETKNLNSHYSPILNGCMNTRNGKATFKNFRVLLNSGCSSIIVMWRIIEKLCLE